MATAICGEPTDDGSECERPVSSETDRCFMHDENGPPSSHGADEGNDHAEGNAGGGPPGGNSNAVSHGAYIADKSKLYTEVFDVEDREIADEIYADYYSLYQDRHGNVPDGVRQRLVEISVNAVAEFHVDNWAIEKPDDVDSGTVYIDREECVIVASQDTTLEKYRTGSALEAKLTLSRENRRWLKDLGLLDRPGMSGDHCVPIDPKEFEGSN